MVLIKLMSKPRRAFPLKKLAALLSFISDERSILMRLWLDDLREMPPSFDQHARTAAEAIRWLSNGQVTEVSLDHDLGAADNGTGYDVAEWIEQKAFLWSQGDATGLSPLLWSVHSQNPVGVEKMKQALRNADRYWASVG